MSSFRPADSRSPTAATISSSPSYSQKRLFRKAPSHICSHISGIRRTEEGSGTRPFRKMIRGLLWCLCLLSLLCGCSILAVKTRTTPSTIQKVAVSRVISLGAFVGGFVASQGVVKAIEGSFAPPALGVNKAGSFDLCTGNSCVSSQVMPNALCILVNILSPSPPPKSSTVRSVAIMNLSFP